MTMSRPLPRLGEIIAGYSVLKKVGEGNRGVVYQARDARGETVALKVLKPDCARDADLVREFLDEAAATDRIDHEGVVKVLGDGAEDGRHHLLMEFVDGPPLDRVLTERGRISWRTATRIMIGLANGLAAAHAKGLIHRDVKPANILLMRDGSPKIVDFGIVKDIGTLKGFLVNGRRVGTAAYASPEQCLGKRLSESTDMYSLGATFYHMVCGRPPFEGKSTTEVMKKHVRALPVPPADLIRTLPKGLSKAIEKMLAKKQTDRFESMEKLASDLEMILEGKVAISAGKPRVERTSTRGSRPPRTAWRNKAGA
jgi:eukaryotic-like serine/threonine-protein kinase